MRWAIRGLAAILVIWLAYLASPYVALYGIFSAIESRDAKALYRRVNFHALRVSLSKQVVTAYLGTLRAKGELGSSERQAAVGAIVAIADPIVAQFLSAEGILSLLTVAEQAAAAPGAAAEAPRTEDIASGIRSVSTSQIWGLLGSAQSHGFRNVFFLVPPDKPPDQQFRLQLRLSSLRWRLIGIELPAHLRERLALELAARAKSQ